MKYFQLLLLALSVALVIAGIYCYGIFIYNLTLELFFEVKGNNAQKIFVSSLGGAMGFSSLGTIVGAWGGFKEVECIRRFCLYSIFVSGFTFVGLLALSAVALFFST